MSAHVPFVDMKAHIAALRGEVDHAVEAVAREQAFDSRAVGDVELLELEAGPPQLLEARELQVHT